MFAKEEQNATETWLVGDANPSFTKIPLSDDEYTVVAGPVVLAHENPYANEIHQPLQ
jgi:hypothetical protein